jgi:PAS domain S-box-containing protein
MNAIYDKVANATDLHDSLDATAAALTSLANSAGGFEAIAHQLPLTIIVLDRDLKVRWLNEVAAASIDRPAEMAIGQYWPSIARGPRNRFEIYSRVLAGEQVDAGEVQVPRAGGTMHFEGLCRPLRDAAGEVIGILIVGQDVTQRHLAERALEESERRFRLLADQSHDIVAVVSPAGQLRYVNRAVERTLGYSADEIVGRFGLALVHPEDASQVRARLQAVLREGPDRKPVTIEFRVRHKDGSWRWLESLPAILSAGPEGPSVLTATRDVTERKRAEADLRLSEERYRLAIRAMNGVIYEWNVATAQILRTPGLGEWLDLAEDELPRDAAEWMSWVHPEDRRSPEDVLALLQAEGQLEVSYRVRRARGDYASLWERSILVTDGDGRPLRVIGFVMNRTEASRSLALREATERTAAIGGWEQNFRTGQIYWTDHVFELYDLEPKMATPVAEETRPFFAPESVSVLAAAFDAAQREGTAFDVEARMVSAKGRVWWARIVAEVERDMDGQPLRAYGAIQDITERKQAEIELTTRSQWLEVSLSTAKMSAWRLDVATGAVYTAARSADLGRMTVTPTTLDALYDVMHPSDRERVQAELARATTARGTFEIAYRTRMIDGSWAWKHSFGRVETGDAGRPMALIGATQDITDRKRAETALKASERMLRQVTRHSTDSLTLIDRRLRIRFTNRPVNGRTVAEMEGRPLADFLPPERVSGVLATLRRVLASAVPDSYSLEIPGAAGAAKHYEFRVSPIVDDDVIEGLVINGSDVTQHILAERAIATQARMIDSMLEGVAVIDSSGRIEITNPAFDRMFAYPRGALLGIEIGALADADEENLAFGRTGAAEAGQADVSHPFEFDAQRRDGAVFTVAGIVTPFEIAGGDHRLVVLQDVSERKALEREILEAGSREQQRIGADLHDGLGQELTGIALMLKSISSRLGAEYPRLLPELEGITRLVSDAVESTRSLARGLSPVTLERRGLIDALEGLAMQAREAYRVNVSFQHRVRAGVELGQALADHLYRIAQEALANAMRHGRADSVAIRLTTHGQRIRLQITDDGIGLPATALEAPGLGLKIMRYRARMVGGEIRLEKNGRRGTRVFCECPVESRGRQAGAPQRGFVQ